MEPKETWVANPKNKHLPAETRLALWDEFFADRSEENKRKLIETYLYLVETISHDFRKRISPNIDYGEMVSEGYFGLVRAIEKYDHSYGYKFETYGTRRVKGAILDFLRKTDWVPRYDRIDFKNYENVRDSLAQELKREATVSEIAERMGLSVDEVNDIVYGLETSVIYSINFALGEESNFEDLESITPDIGVDDIGVRLEWSEYKDSLSEALSDIPEVQQTIIWMYHFEGYSYDQIAEILEVSSNRVKNILREGIVNVRERLTNGV